MSEAVANTMARVYDYPADRTFFMPLPAPDFEARRHGRQAPVGRPWRLLFFGRIHEYKGLELLAQAYALLCERFSVTLRVVGEGHVEALTKLAALPGVTIEQGWVPDTEITSVFSQADIVVLPYIKVSQSGVLVICLLLLASSPSRQRWTASRSRSSSGVNRSAGRNGNAGGVGKGNCKSDIGYATLRTLFGRCNCSCRKCLPQHRTRRKESPLQASLEQFAACRRGRDCSVKG